MKKKPLSYMDLVISIVRGLSPVPELQHFKVDYQEEAKKYLSELKKNPPLKSKKSWLLKGIQLMGPKFLAKAWARLSPPALTMSGEESIQQLLQAMKTVVDEKIPGDFIETGVWRGGLPLIMRAFLQDKNILDRVVYLADSFQGLPSEHSDPRDSTAHALLDPISHLQTSRQLVEECFEFFGLLDEQVIFLEGWFKDTLVKMPERPLAIVRLDGDYYESTRDAIETLYPKLSVGGYLIVDDYNLPLGCKKAIHEYRDKYQIHDPMIKINKQAIFWRKGP